MQITGCSQTADLNKADRKTEQAQGTEKEGTAAEESSAETEKNGSGTGEAGREQSAGSSQAAAKAAAGQGDSMNEYTPGMPIKEGVAAPDFTEELKDGTSITLSELQGKPVIINFWATWCGPCMRQAPIVEEIAAEGYTVGKVDVDQEPALAQQFRIMSIPTLLVFKNGKEANRVVGLTSKNDLLALLND